MNTSSLSTAVDPEQGFCAECLVIVGYAHLRIFGEQGTTRARLHKLITKFLSGEFVRQHMFGRGTLLSSIEGELPAEDVIGNYLQDIARNFQKIFADLSIASDDYQDFRYPEMPFMPQASLLIRTWRPRPIV